MKCLRVTHVVAKHTTFRAERARLSHAMFAGGEVCSVCVITQISGVTVIESRLRTKTKNNTHFSSLRSHLPQVRPATSRCFSPLALVCEACLGDVTGATQTMSFRGSMCAGILQGNRWIQDLLMGGPHSTPAVDQRSWEYLTLDEVADSLRHHVEAVENHGLVDAA